MDWFKVDKNGLAKVLARRGGIAWAVAELYSNAVDEKTTRVEIELVPAPASGARAYRLKVTDDSPDGFVDLSHAFTLFAESAKKGNPVQRGRFNLGEKLVLAVCSRAHICSMKGGVVFDEEGRRATRQRTDAGTVFEGIIPKVLSRDVDAVREMVRMFVVPKGVALYYNGEFMERQVPVATFDAPALQTEIADAEGNIVRSVRNTTVTLYVPRVGEKPHVYELGVPVCPHDGKYHYDVQQRVPQNLERDNVPAAYLAKLHALALNVVHAQLGQEDVTQAWVKVAAERPESSVEAVKSYLDVKYGENRVSYDPSDPEANKLAMEKDFSVVPGGSESAALWQKARDARLIQPAGQVTPSVKAFGNGPPVKLLDDSKVTADLRNIQDYAMALCKKLCDPYKEYSAVFVCDVAWSHSAAFGPSGVLYLNVARLGYAWFRRENRDRINDLLIHELAHWYSLDHKGSDYYEALTLLGSKMIGMALDNPVFFRTYFDKAPVARERDAALSGV
jgi:hypothetical protein